MKRREDGATMLGVEVEDELTMMLKAVYDSTTVDLVLQEAPGEDDKPLLQSLVTSSSNLCDRKEDEELRGPILNGEKVRLMLVMTPKRELLGEIFGHAFGLSGKANEEKQLAAWNALTSSLYAHIHLLPASHDLVRKSVDDDSDGLVVLYGRDGDERYTDCTTYPLQHVRPSRVASLLDRNGRSYCRPSVYSLEFVVKEEQADHSDLTKYYVHLTVELAGLTSLKKGIAKVTGRAPECVESLVAEALRTVATENMSTLCSRSYEDDKSVLTQLSGITSSFVADKPWSDSCLMTMLLPAYLLDPLKIEVKVAVPSPGYNCVQVSISNALTHDIEVRDLYIHLPTAVAKERKERLQKTPLTTMCILTSTPTVHNTATSSGTPSGFEALFKLQCYRVAVEGEELPIVLHGGETYIFMFVLKPYDIKPSPATLLPARHLPKRGTGSMAVVSPTTAGGPVKIPPASRRTSSGEPPPVALFESVDQSCQMTTAFNIKGLSSTFDKQATVNWKLQTRSTPLVAQDDRLKSITKFMPPRVRRRDSTRLGRSRSVSPPPAAL